MLRRNFFRWLSSSFLSFLFARFGRAQASSLGESETLMMLEVAAVVLPSALGRSRTDEIGKQFVRWTQEYKSGADAGYGYGFPKLLVLPGNPAAGYPDQLRRLEAAASANDRPFASLAAETKRRIIAAALEDAKIDRIPPRPNGKHIAADLLAFFYNSADGQDLLYQAAIRRDDCRGLETSAQRPQALS